MTAYPYHLSITSSLSADYEIMHRGLTDAVCIIGFADCAATYQNSVYRVDDLNAAMSIFTGSTTYESTLVKGLIECYTGGCRDIYLYPIASMSSYVPDADRTLSFWSSLYSSYQTALSIIAEVDDIDIIVPYDVNIAESTVDDFLTLLSDHCESITGSSLRIVFLPYDGVVTSTYPGDSYHIVFIDGIGTYHFPEVFSLDYSSHMAATFAGFYSNISPEVPPDNRELIVPIMFDSDHEDVEETLEANRIVGFRKTVKYKRVYDSSLVTTLSYTRASAESDFSKLYAVHVIQRLLRGIEALDLTNSAAYLAQDSLEKFFKDWVDKGYSTNVEATYKLQGYTLYVGILVTLPYPIGSITLNMTVGPLTQ